MADTSFVGESAATLAASLMRLRTDEETRRRALRRGLAAAAVVVLHAAFFYMLLQADWLPAMRTIPPAKAPLLWLLLPKTTGTPKAVQQQAQKEGAPDRPVMRNLPITLPPRPDAIDFGLVLGRALACGANSFEYLTPEGRSSCKRTPWNYTYAKDGTIILNTQYQRPEPQPTPADVLAHERYTAPACPEYIDPNAPCISGIIGGH
ncbi:MAG TPA: hypothetical protein VGC27_08590 [Rhizomicrobium sp.]